MNKIIVGISAALVITSTVTAYSLFRDNQNQQRQLEDFGNQVNQLLSHVEDTTAQRLEFEKQIEQLNSEILVSENRVKVVNNDLEEFKRRVDPDFEQIERDLRRQISNEIRREVQANENPAPARLVRQLSEMNIEDRRAVMSVQGRYNRFLDALNTSPERKELITRALIDVSIEQNRAQQELVSRARQELIGRDRPPEEFQAEMLSIMGPQATREALSYELTDDELALFDQLQANQNMAFTSRINNGGEIRIQTSGSTDALLVNPDTMPAPGQRIFIQQLQPGIPGPQQ